MLGQRKKIFSATVGEKLFNICNIIILSVITILIVYPFWNCIIMSFNEGADAIKAPLYWLPRKFTLNNYAYVLKSSRTLYAAFISLMRTITGTLLQLAVTGLVAYGLSKKQLLGRKIYMVYFIITMYFSGGLIPTYLLYRDIGFLDNFLVYIVPGAWSFFNAILMMAYYDSIPEALEEAAIIDGAGKIKIFTKIIFPASIPIFATVAIFTGVAQWNSWFDTSIFTSSDKLITLQSIMMKLINEAAAMQEMAKHSSAKGMSLVKPSTVRVATLIVTTFPITVVYPFLQQYFVKGILIGSVKG